MLQLNLPTEIEDRLDLLSLRTGHTRGFYVIEALLEYLDDIENRAVVLENLESFGVQEKDQ